MPSASPSRETAETHPVTAFITRWQGREGGQERANYALFLTELCDALNVPRPDPASASTEENDYVFERAVLDPAPDGSASARRIDLYKRGCFVLEAKQSRQKGGAKEVLGQTDVLPKSEPARRGTRGAGRTWDVLMLNARRQAEGYARALPVSHGWPPFILVCDVGHVIELYADFSGQGKNYAQFPDRQSFRIFLDDLAQPEIRERLARIWTDPLSLDPARESARVTRTIAERLAAVSKALESAHHTAEDVAFFLMRCLFTMFAEDVDLLPSKSFRDVLQRCERDPSRLQHLVGQLWEAMDTGGFAFAIEQKVRRFNGEFFKTRTVLPLGREEIGELRRAAESNWHDVDPSIFGTLLEQALNDTERRRLGAHYTPRAYVERLVVATIIEPLRADWDQVISTAERQKSEGRTKDAIATVRSFHDKLCATRILDPACGTGNFLYVSLELLKRLEGEVLEALADLGGQEALRGLEGHTVDPHQFLGLEINPRAAAIAELVLWIGYLQWHLRTKGGMPSEPILRAFHNIIVQDAVLEAEITLARDKSGRPRTRQTADSSVTEIYDYAKPRRPLVGNPPFIGGKDIRSRLGTEYAEALWAAHPHINESADYVLYFWDHAAQLLNQADAHGPDPETSTSTPAVMAGEGRPSTSSRGKDAIHAKATLRRFGLVTTNSISQVFQRRVVEAHLKAKSPISIIMAIPDHPWTKAAPDSAAVGIAMTVAEAGTKEGVLQEVTKETALDTDAPLIDLNHQTGIINPDLTVGVDVTTVTALQANEGVCSPGVKLHGAGFIVTPEIAEHLGIGRRKDLDKHIRNYRNGRDLTSRPRGVMVIDFDGLSADDVRSRFPAAYQHLLLSVKPARDAQFAKSPTKDSEAYAREWWLLGKSRPELRSALIDLPRYIATVETTKHRVFQFLDASILPDNMLVNIGSDDGFTLGVLSSRLHVVWTGTQGGTLEDRPRYTKSRCFDPFPFPTPNPIQTNRIRTFAEDLDSHRKQVLADHPHLTLTGLYNVLEDLRAGTSPDALTPTNRRIFEDGLVLILKELHDRLDTAVAEAYGWPTDLTDNEILIRLVALNRERAEEEANGLVRWLRPDYQIPRFATAQQKAELQLTGGGIRQPQVAPATTPKPLFPTDNVAQTAAIMAALGTASAPIAAAAITAGFRQGRRIAPQVNAVLTALTRMGFITTNDGGRAFILHRAA